MKKRTIHLLQNRTFLFVANTKKLLLAVDKGVEITLLFADNLTNKT